MLDYISIAKVNSQILLAKAKIKKWQNDSENLSDAKAKYTARADEITGAKNSMNMTAQHITEENSDLDSASSVGEAMSRIICGEAYKSAMKNIEESILEFDTNISELGAKIEAYNKRLVSLESELERLYASESEND